jgi:molecular chaperone GrpE
MSEPTSPSGVEGSVSRPAGALGAELIDQLLADFRAWLQEASVAAPAPEPAAPPDWSSVLQQWIALRQEVNLQTRASRAQLEQNGQVLDEVARAIDLLQRANAPAGPERQDERVRGLLKVLLDVYDSVALGRREVQRQREAVPERLKAAPEPQVPLPWWARWLGLQAAVERGLEPVRTWLQTQALEEVQVQRQKLDAVLVGYQMGLQRLERMLAQHGLEPIECVGEPFDPERMEVVEVVRDAERNGTEVLEEVRRGYLINGRVFRFAQVRVARP